MKYYDYEYDPWEEDLRNRHREQYFEDFNPEDYEELICVGCSGSGEGMHESANCSTCGGSGVEYRLIEKSEEEDYE